MDMQGPRPAQLPWLPRSQRSTPGLCEAISYLDAVATCHSMIRWLAHASS